MLPSVRPPSTVIDCPVIKFDSSWANQSAVAAMSLGVPMRPTRWLFSNFCLVCSGLLVVCMYFSLISVAIYPGQLQLHTIPSLAQPKAIEFAKARSPPMHHLQPPHSATAHIHTLTT